MDCHKTEAKRAPYLKNFMLRAEKEGDRKRITSETALLYKKKIELKWPQASTLLQSDPIVDAERGVAVDDLVKTLHDMFLGT